MPITRTNTGFEKLENKIKKPSVSKMADIIISGNKDNYRKSLNADGTAMSPLSPERIRYKQRIGARFPRKPLVFTEQLMNAFDKRRLNKDHYQVSVQDKLRSGGITNTGILNIQKASNRQPFGFGKSIYEKVSAYVKSIVGVQ